MRTADEFEPKDGTDPKQEGMANWEKDYPSVELAYPFAVGSYEWASKRLDSTDSRIQTLMSLAVTLTIAIPVALKAMGMELVCWWMGLVVALFVGVIGLGAYGRLRGAMKVVDPSVLYEKYLHYTQWEFKKNFIYWSGHHYKANRVMLARKWKITVAMSCLLFLEVVAVVLWVSFRS